MSAITVPRTLRLLTVLAAILAVLTSSRKMIGSRLAQGDMEAYLHAARSILAGEDIYLLPSRPVEMGGLYYIYPPPLAVLFTPLTLVPAEAAIVAWTVFNVFLLGWILKAFYEAMTGSPLSALNDRDRWIIIAFSLLPPSRYILHHLSYGQANILVMALAVLGLREIQKTHSLRGGLACGLSIAIKTITFPLAVWLCFERNFRSVITAAAGAAAGLLLPALVLGFSRNWSYLVFWFENIVPYGDVMMGKVPLPVNVSFQAQLHRFFGDGVAFTYDNTPYYFTALRLPDASLAVVERSLMLVMFVAMAVYWYRFRHAGEIVSHWGGVALTFSLVPAFTPVAQKHYLVLLLPAFIYIAHVWYGLQLRDRWFRGLAAASFILLFFTNEEFWGEFLGGVFNGLGCIAWGTLLASAAVFRAGVGLSETKAGDK